MGGTCRCPVGLAEVMSNANQRDVSIIEPDNKTFRRFGVLKQLHTAARVVADAKIRN